MKRYLLIVIVLVVIFSLLFGLAEWLQIPFLSDPSAYMQDNKAVAAGLGTLLLMLDVFFPVPASIVMGLNGKLFGVPLGTLLSLVGTMGAASLGFVIGRRGGALLDRIVKPEERVEANRLLERYGVLAIIVTRPVPMLAETMTLLAGTSGMSWPRMLLASFAGSLPACYLFARAGEEASVFAMFGWVLLIATGFWLAGRFLMRTAASAATTDASTAPAHEERDSVK